MTATPTRKLSLENRRGAEKTAPLCLFFVKLSLAKHSDCRHSQAEYAPPRFEANARKNQLFQSRFPRETRGFSRRGTLQILICMLQCISSIKSARRAPSTRMRNASRRPQTRGVTAVGSPCAHPKRTPQQNTTKRERNRNKTETIRETQDEMSLLLLP